MILAVKTPGQGAIIVVDVELSEDNGLTWNSICGGVTAGTHDGGDDEATLTNSSGAFTEDMVGLIIENTTDGSSGLITAVNSPTNLTAALSGGDNDWDTDDIYIIAVGGGILPGDYVGTGGIFTVSELDRGDILRLDVEQCGVSPNPGADLMVSLRVSQ